MSLHLSKLIKADIKFNDSAMFNGTHENFLLWFIVWITNDNCSQLLFSKMLLLEIKS